MGSVFRVAANFWGPIAAISGATSFVLTEVFCVSEEVVDAVCFWFYLEDKGSWILIHFSKYLPDKTAWAKISTDTQVYSSGKKQRLFCRNK